MRPTIIASKREAGGTLLVYIISSKGGVSIHLKTRWNTRSLSKKKKLLVCSFLLIREERLERGLWEFVRRDWSAAFQYLNFSRALAASGGVDDGVNYWDRAAKRERQRGHTVGKSGCEKQGDERGLLGQRRPRKRDGRRNEPRSRQGHREEGDNQYN